MNTIKLVSALIWCLLTASLLYADGYDRAQWKAWIDADGDCQNTRAEVLIRDSLIPVTLSKDGCRVVAGLWACPYTGKVSTDPEDFDIDHLVPLHEAHLSGGAAWGPSLKATYGNFLGDSRHLLTVLDRANQDKGDKDPARWMPPNRAYWGEYLEAWIAVKKDWDLSFDSQEAKAIEYMLKKARFYDKGDKDPLDSRATYASILGKNMPCPDGEHEWDRCTVNLFGTTINLSNCRECRKCGKREFSE